jgi:hypothetical protein
MEKGIVIFVEFGSSLLALSQNNLKLKMKGFSKESHNKLYFINHHFLNSSSTAKKLE